MKGIILAGGSGTRLYPITQGISKQLMPIYNKPMIYYPLSTLMSSGMKEILVITTPFDIEHFRRLLGDGSHLGISISYAIQDQPRGLADAFRIGADFIGNDDVALVLGDNIFHGSQLTERLSSISSVNGGIVFAYEVRDPQRYGVVTFDDQGRATSIEEKPAAPQSNFAVVGLYYYDNRVVEIAQSITPSQRGELEITAINQAYLQAGHLNVVKLARGDVWLDTGTFDSLSEASSYVEVLEKRTGIVIGSPEATAYHQGFISAEELKHLAQRRYAKSGYGALLLNTLK
ncbi:glucose-1-phosphate thymidylyltransferase RfbA [Corynebacterium sp. ES2775-CONJ]|uniref:glucose-1-phosphate thymidylyltransferase RfbA n=1 Tax=Corynebacterium sp. ES2775-CONJ TaxID=2974029 RepID=UPI00216768B0|nr:glucose-1-phosphate thymidylyltransferase RfbA [Corynebacterium sp. ES2775-CONJ]MCS4489754.1 glucose-1-phosphate thymidylyltransferase RfbA [Corynebacterium sp. ES2775-CONJ]